MKKIALAVCLMTIFFTGCVIDMDQLTAKPQYTQTYRNTYKKKPSTAPAVSGVDRKIVMQRTVAAYARAVKNSGVRCNLTPEEVAYCFSRNMFGNIYEGSTIRMRNGDVWHFFVNGVCVRKGECKVVITSQGINYPVDLLVDRSGYIVVENPTLQR